MALASAKSCCLVSLFSSPLRSSRPLPASTRQLMEETTLLDHFAAIDQSHGFSQSPTAIAHDGLQSSFQRQPALLQSLQEVLPLSVLFTAGYFPIEHLASAIGPKAEGH